MLTGNRTLANAPGRKSPFGLAKTPRIRIVPVFASTWLSMPFTVPLCGKPFSSANPIAIGIGPFPTCPSSSSPFTRNHFRLGPVQRCLERPRVDLEQQIALLDQRSRLEMDLLQYPADPGAKLDFLDGLQPAREGFVVRDLALYWLNNGDRRRLVRRDGS